MQTWCVVIWSHLRILRERERFTHTVCESMSHRNFYNYFRSYLMKKYELYNIIIISPAPDRDRDGAAACVVNHLMAGTSSTWDRLFERPPIKHPRGIISWLWSVSEVHTSITCGKTWNTLLNKYKEWHWFLYIFFLFDFIILINKYHY